MLAHVRDSLFAQLESVLVARSRERLSFVCLAGERISCESLLFARLESILDASSCERLSLVCSAGERIDF